MDAARQETTGEIGLIDRLAGHGIRYFAGERSGTSTPTPIGPLAIELSRSPDGRLRSALVALVLLHPEYAHTIEAAARDLPGHDASRGSLLLSIVAAAALQREWAFTLDLYLPDRPRIAAESLAQELGLPSPDRDYGRPCLLAGARLMSAGSSVPTNHVVDWEDATHRLIRQLVLDAAVHGA